MTRRKNRKKKKLSPTLASLFKMSQEQLQTRKTTGGGTHRRKNTTHLPRHEQKRRVLREEMIE